MKRLIMVFAASLLLASCSTSNSACYSISSGKGMPTPVSKGSEAGIFQAKGSKTPYYNKPIKKKKAKPAPNRYTAKWWDF